MSNAENVDTDEDDGRPFTPSERKAVRALIRSRERLTWLTSIIRTWALWISGTLAAVYALTSFVKDGLKAVVRSGGGS